MGDEQKDSSPSTINSIVYNINNVESNASLMMITGICYLIDDTAQNPPANSAEETFFSLLV